MNQLYTVTLTELASYRITVAASSESEAQSVATTVVLDEAAALPPGLTRQTRELSSVVELSQASDARHYRVGATYSVDFEMVVPATSRAEAERHARRLYDDNCGPFDFDSGEPRVGHFNAVEVQS
jgi:hypothetical protein